MTYSKRGVSAGWVLGLASLLCVQPGLAASAAEAVPAGAQALPIDVTQDMIHADVMINGLGPYHFIVDTGTGDAVCISPDLTKKLGLKPSGTQQQTDGVTKQTIQVPQYTFDLDYHGMKRAQVKAATVPLEPGDDGILGFPFFKDYLLTLDIAGKQLRLEHGSLPAADGATILDYQDPDGVPSILASLGGHSQRFDLDSGQPNLIFESAEAAKDLVFSKPPKVVGKAGSSQAEFTIEAGQLRGSLQVGKFHLDDPVVIFSTAFSGGNLGFPLFQRYSMTFDQANKRVRFRETAPPPAPQRP